MCIFYLGIRGKIRKNKIQYQNIASYLLIAHLVYLVFWISSNCKSKCLRDAIMPLCIHTHCSSFSKNIKKVASYV